MKKIRINSLMILLFGICAMFGMSVVKALNDLTVSQTLTVVCNPTTISNGQQTKCYIVAVPDTNDAANSSLHGFVSKAFVTKDLQIIKAENNNGIANTAVGFTNPQTATGTETITGDDIPDEVSKVKCNFDAAWVENAHKNGAVKSDKHNDFACAVFYTKKSAPKNAYTQSSILTGSQSFKDSVLKDYNDTYGVIGNYIVKKPEGSKDGGSCGEICIMAWGVKSLAEYATFDSGGSDDTPLQTICTEIGRISENPHPGITPPDTGAFISYAILVAGALIAIGAVVIAKKNNTFSKI